MTTSDEEIRWQQRFVPPEEGGPVDVHDLLRILEVEQLDRDLFRADNLPQRPAFDLYGGQVAAQALRAAALTVPVGRHPHSFHAYFLRRGLADRRPILEVHRDRDGRSFSARRVVARQDGEVIFAMSTSFHADEPGGDHQVPAMPAVPDPDELPPAEAIGLNVLFEYRDVPPVQPDGPGMAPRVWARTRGPLPDDRVLHACALTFLSDMSSGFAGVPEEVRARIDLPRGGPSLDHAIWFHRPVRLDDWVLVDLYPVSAAGARGLYGGSIFSRAGVLGASLTQEALLRPRGHRPPPAPLPDAPKGCP